MTKTKPATVSFSQHADAAHFIMNHPNEATRILARAQALADWGSAQEPPTMFGLLCIPDDMALMFTIGETEPAAIIDALIKRLTEIRDKK